MENSAFCAYGPGLVLEALALAPEKIILGQPITCIKVLQEWPDGRQCGIWEHSDGVSSDVEREETFVILSGRATVSIEGGPTLHLQPGSVGGFRTGDRTVWHVHETLRKFYQAFA